MNGAENFTPVAEMLKVSVSPVKSVPVPGPPTIGDGGGSGKLIVLTGEDLRLGSRLGQG